MKYILAIDLGGTKTAVGLLNKNGEVLDKKIFPTDAKKGFPLWFKKTIKIINDLFDQYQIKPSLILGLTVAAAGAIDRKNGILISAPNLKNWRRIAFKKFFQKHFRFPVVLENDANIAALAEWALGAGKGSRNMIYLTVSTGVGGGIIVNNKIYRGQGSAGELGHMILNPNGSKCGCGNYGCLETLASGTAVGRLAREKILKNKKSQIWLLAGKKFENIKAKIVYLAARQGDFLAKQIVQETQKWLAVGLVNIIHALHPEVVVLGGGMMRDADMILPNIKKQVKKMTMAGFKAVQVKKTKFGEDVGLVGGFVLINKKITLRQ